MQIFCFFILDVRYNYFYIFTRAIDASLKQCTEINMPGQSAWQTTDSESDECLDDKGEEDNITLTLYHGDKSWAFKRISRCFFLGAVVRDT